ncbi:MAG: DNA recombination/repair protein RecA, partial [Pygmaiobacter sp.]
RAKVVKNKVAPPFKEGEFDIMFGQGISKEGEILDLGVKLDLVQKSGAWFNCGEIRLGQGRDNAKEYLKANPELSATIEQQVRDNAYKLSPVAMRKIAADAAVDAAAVAAKSVDDAPKKDAAPAKASSRKAVAIEDDIDISVD